MKFKIVIDQNLKQMKIHCNIEVKPSLLSKIKAINGVTTCVIGSCDKYNITLYKGEVFDWSDIEHDASIILECEK